MTASDRLSTLLEFLRFPSISTEPRHADDMRACAEWLSALFSASGLTPEIRETGGHPLVLAKSPAQPGRKTVLIYGHYDVQPADPVELWNSPPVRAHRGGRDHHCPRCHR